VRESKISTTFQQEDALVDEGAVVAVAHVPSGAGSPEQSAWYADLPGGFQGKAHDVVADDAAGWRHVRGGVERPWSTALKCGRQVSSVER
jgi:hypothetical protein